MAILNFTGWELGDDSEGEVLGSASVQNSVTRGAWSDYALRTNPTTTAVGHGKLWGLQSNGDIYYTLGNAPLWIRFYVRIDTLPASDSEEIFRFNDVADAIKFSLRVNNSGLTELYDSANTLVSTGSTVLSTGVWYRIGLLAPNASGTAEWYINGSLEDSLTVNTGLLGYAYAVFGKYANSNGQTIDCYYDDVCLDNSALPGEGQCSLLRPSANGTYQTWSIGAGSGSHYQVVDEVPPDTADYLASTAVDGDAETEAIENLPASGITVRDAINSVKAVALVTLDNIAVGAVRIRLRSGSTDLDTSVNYATSSIYNLICNLANTDPDTSSPWAASDLDGVETGCVEKSSVASRMAFTGLMVEYTPTEEFAAAIAGTVGAPTADISAEFDPPVFTGTIAGTIGAAVASIAALVDPPTFTGTISGTIGAATMGAAAMFTRLPQYRAWTKNIDGTLYTYRLAYNNLQATVDPTVSDDASLNYAPGSVWVNKTGQKIFQCVRSTIGAAVWNVLSSDRVFTDTTTVVWDLSTPGELMANAYQRYEAENKEGASISAGMVVAVHSSGTGVSKASAADSTKPAVGLLVATTANTFSGQVQTGGPFTLADWTAVTGSSSLSAHALYFLDPGTPGMLTTTVPATTGQVLQIMGTAISADTLELNVESPTLL